MKYDFPKIDLHLHLDGSMLPETAWELAKERKIPMPAESLAEFRRFIVVTADCRSVNEYLERFEMPLAILQDAASLARVTRELIGLLASQGLCYAEIRFAPQLHTRLGMTQRRAIEAVLEGRRQGLAANPSINANMICCAMCIGPETANMAENLETVRAAAEYLGRGVAAVDLAGAEGIVPLANFSPVFALARELGVPYTCHAGDSQGPDTVRDAMDMGARRIGHGHHVFEDKALCARAIDEGVTFEICPTSNVQCQSVSGYAAHPAKAMLDMGMRVTINTDNMILSDINLDKEYDRCITQMGFCANDLVRMNIYSAEAAFCPEEEKRAIKERLRKYLG